MHSTADIEKINKNKLPKKEKSTEMPVRAKTSTSKICPSVGLPQLGVLANTVTTAAIAPPEVRKKITPDSLKMEDKMQRSCNEPYPTEEWPFQSNKEENISYGEPEPSHTHKTPQEWWGCLNSTRTEKTAPFDEYDQQETEREQWITEYFCHLKQLQEKPGVYNEAAKTSNEDGDPSIPEGTVSSKSKRKKKKSGSSLTVEVTDTSADPVEKKGDLVALQPRKNGEFVPRLTEYPEGPRQKSCTPKACLSGANSEEPSTNHPREVEPEPVSDDPLTNPEDALKIARHDCDLLCEELEREKNNNAELQKTVLAIYSAAKTELDDLKTELDTAKATISAMDVKQSQSDKMVATLKRKYEEALKQMTVFQQEVHTLRIELNASQQEVNSVRIEVDVSQKEVQTLRRALDASHHETNSCRTDLEVSRKVLHRLTEELDIAKETIGNLDIDLKVAQKELQTLNLEKEVSRQEIVILKADVRKWKEDCKEALKNTETEKRENSRLKTGNLKLKEENFQLTEEVKEKFEAEHRLQNQLQGLRTHIQYAEEKQQTLQEEKLQAAKEIQVLQERLMAQYVPAKQHEKLKATLSITKATLKAKLRTQVMRHKREHKKVQKLKQVTVAQAKKFIVLHNAIKMWRQAQRKQSMQINSPRRDLQDALKKQGSLADEITVLQGQVLTLTKRQYPTASKTHEDKGTVRAGNTAHLKDNVAKFEPPKQALAKPSATQQATKEGTRAELKPEESLADEAEKMELH
ncbi:uncharacterized protein LOC142476626 [Ascaphus truei]|uniref:uncharacterized protein LOC142476626 n=1 Tax=Ascaphus truei TaxID=8439 RepID=UPI003F5993BE